MRLNRLDLSRYGKFTDFGIDFGDRPEGRADLHVVYGPNEAGKSTTLSAFLDLLFGIEKNSGYGFLHPYETMRIGAALDLAGGVRDFVRIKRQQNSLLDGHDQPVAPATILTDLGGIDRKAYVQMFSLDDASLEEGGETILASKGDLGELLFSASAGLADLGRSLGAIRDEADRFFKTSRTGALAEFKKRLEALKAERASIDTRASEYAGLLKARDQAAGLYDGTLASRGLIQQRIDEIGRHLAALPRLTALRRLTEDLAAFAELPEAPPHWVRDLPGLQREETELGVRAAAVADEIERLSTLLDGLVVDRDALRHAEGVAALADARARHRTAEKDLPDRRQRLRDAEAAIGECLHRIERDDEADPARLVLSASLTGRLRDLVEARSGVEAAVRSAAAELATAERRYEDAKAKLPVPPVGPDRRRPRELAMAALAATVASLRTGDHGVRRRLAQRALEAALASCTDRLRDLRPWEGDVDALARLDVPEAETLACWRSGLANGQKVQERRVEEAERLETEHRRLVAERDALVASTGIVTDQEAESLRAARDRAWSDHRQSLDADTAERFEHLLRSDDAVTGRRFFHVVDLARLNQVSQASTVAQTMAARAAELRDEAAASLSRLGDEIAGAIRDGAPALAGAPLPRFEAWLARRHQALEAGTVLRNARDDLKQAIEDGEAARSTLRAAMEGAGVDAGADGEFAAMLASAQEACDWETTLKGLMAAAAERAREVDERTRARDEALMAERAWSLAWSAACSACWLGDAGDPPMVSAVREILSVLVDLGSALKDRAGLAQRIGAMEKDQTAFGAALRAVAADLGIGEGSSDVAHLARLVDARIAKALSDAERRAAEAEALRDAQDRQRALAEAVAIHRQRAVEMTGAFGVETLNDVAARLVDVARRDELRRRAEEAERDVVEMLRVASLADAERALAQADRDALGLELAGLESRFQDLDQRCRELFLAQARAVGALEAVGGDAKVAEIEERRRTTLLEIEEGALRYLKLRAGTLAAEHALRAYRDRHRSSMLAQASEAFSTISRGAYAGLSAQPREGGGETLIALVAGGGSKQAGELSKGTRFQLYLALRVAGYHEFARSRPPVPFLADDIMETFDDFRAEEAFRLFGGMAEVGQVIYLTHHRHLCEIARSVCPGARIHDIGAR